MQISTLLASFLAGAAVVAAVPAMDIDKRNPPQMPICPNIYNNPECCATDVLGVADLDCQPRKL